MIFVTVGTHEQPFDRLLQYIDEMVEKEIIKEKVIIQKGFTNFELKFCEQYKLIGYEEMENYIKNARIVITHGGPSSFILPLSMGKIPIVVPRRKKFNEHVNDHQLEFVKQVEKRMKNIIVAENKNDIQNSILKYDEKIKFLNSNLNSNNEHFVENLKKEIKFII